ncbi:MAG: DNA-binding transcriptional regulator OxyR [Gammaproteobacteria bacterium]|jgi:LysR family hydrogen peroxide-inducible transcriptional activator|nr:DNA-binding transcriptional regulator OxyR [Gammaproteobacteria bacterium]
MNLRDLTYLIKVAELRHFGKAAQACFVSQPTLSMQLKKLEEHLGVTLLERNNKRVMLTPIGEQLVQRARRVLQEVEELQRLAKNAQDPYAKTLRLGVIPTLAPYLLPKVMQPINQAFPKLILQLFEAQTTVLLQKLKSAELDAALLALPLEENNLESCELYQEPFYLAVSNNHPLAAKKQVDYDTLVGQSLLLLDDGHCLREQALDVCQLLGASEQQNFRATSLETLRQMVSVGSGITLMPKMAIRKGDKQIVYLPFTKPQPSRRIGIVWRTTSVDKNLLAELAAFMQTCLQ